MAGFTQRWVDFGQQKSVRAEKYFSGHRQMPLAA
jgi:hypothetical protein